MDSMPILSFLFYSLPESCLIFTFGLLIIGKKPGVPKTVLATIISALFSYIVRMMPIMFGIHTIIWAVIIFILFKYLFKLTMRQAFVATMLSLGTLIALEISVTHLLESKLGLTLEKIWGNPILRTILPLPQLVIWSIITLFIYKRKISLKVS
ncbi:hypothetical protein Psch_02420 [Pelotomaculum schinkii]|uniref:Uncharacterized protein n=1 Tax=Pelotomaculum schinkii TaxID=78350 RepID=A0A4Y7R9I8_9FIRM|nr:hypothetical protein [Pelotomaculum schinkii]TEB05379.1 hypothetical protein Psch_02420 [Pelotomaculum schinkii]